MEGHTLMIVAGRWLPGCPRTCADGCAGAPRRPALRFKCGGGTL